MKRIRQIRLEMWPNLIFGALSVLLLFSLLFFRLGTLTSGLAAAERQAFSQADSVYKIVINPLDAPYKVAQLASVKVLGEPSALALRLAPTLIGALSAGLLYFVLSRWHTVRLAALGTLLFATSSWFLHTSRLALPAAGQLLIVSLIAYGAWLLNPKRPNLVLVLGALTAAAGLYTPGLAWVLLFGVFWQRQRLAELFKKTGPFYQLAAAAIFVALSLPLGISLVQTPALIPAWLALPARWPLVQTVGHNFLGLISSLFWQSRPAPLNNLGDVARLDIFTASMSVLGLYAYYFKLKLDRGRLLLAGLLGALLLLSMNGAADLTLLLPLIYILATAGLTLMIQQWFTVFPRNPLARLLGFCLITAAVLLSVFYHLNHYFLAWPNAPETKAEFASRP